MKVFHRLIVTAQYLCFTEIITHLINMQQALYVGFCDKSFVIVTKSSEIQVRQLNGSKITGPLTTSYNSQNFSLCYFCHAEKNVVGILPGWIPSSCLLYTSDAADE